MSTASIREALEIIPCTHQQGCVHCLAWAEVRHLERAAVVIAAGAGATEKERKGASDLLAHIAYQRVPFRGVRPKDKDVP
jgi:hypothetical protein